MAQWWEQCGLVSIPAPCHVWVEFVVGFSPCFKGFLLGSPVFLPPQKPTLQIPIQTGQRTAWKPAKADASYSLNIVIFFIFRGTTQLKLGIGWFRPLSPPQLILHDFISFIFPTAVIFLLFQTREAASWLEQKMTEDGHAVALLSGEITVEQRIEVLDRFRAGKERLLITNVPLWGIDVEQVNSARECDQTIGWDNVSVLEWKTSNLNERE